MVCILLYIYFINTKFKKKQGQKGFRSIPARAAKPSETWVVHRAGHPSKYQRSPLPLNFSEETDTHCAPPQFVKVWRPKKNDLRKRRSSLELVLKKHHHKRNSWVNNLTCVKYFIKINDSAILNHLGYTQAHISFIGFWSLYRIYEVFAKG